MSFRHRRIVESLFVFLVIVASAQGQQTRTLTVPLQGFYSFDACFGWSADPGEGHASPVVIPLWQFGDVLPAGSRLRAASLAWSLGNGRLFSWQSIPNVSFSLNGTSLGTPQVITNYDSCIPSAAITYTFASGDFPNGFPGYASGQNAVNQITMTL